MTQFIQIHALTTYPISNPNRDDTGRPKAANYGNVPRLRISSQALKRAIRVCDSMQSRLQGNLGERTRRIGDIVLSALKESGIDEKQKEDIAKAITDVFGKPDEQKAKAKTSPRIMTKQLAFVSPDEKRTAIELALSAAKGEGLPDNKVLKKLILKSADGAADIAMFGRMLADDPSFNRDAAVQVAHAFTTHRALVEDDYYTAVDDNPDEEEEDSGAGFIGEAGFGSGVFYLYACIDVDLLIRNLDNDTELAEKAISGFIEGFATATPSGKRTSYAHQTRASYLLVERGQQQPRSLAGAFLKPVKGEDLLESSITQMTHQRQQLRSAYGACCDSDIEMNILAEAVTPLERVISFATES